MSAPLPADDLIARCRGVYAECETYADEGEQRTTYVPADSSRPPHSNLRRFRTRWRRPDRFLFEFRSSHFGADLDDLYAIWTAADGVRSWWTIQPTVRTAPTLEYALGTAAGVSGFTSCYVPDLLRADPDQRTLPPPGGFVGEEKEHEGRRCLAIAMSFSGPSSPQSRRRVWIDMASELLLRVDEITEHTKQAHDLATRRRIEELEASTAAPGPTPELRTQLLERFRSDAAVEFHAFRSESMTTFRPRLNVPLHDAEFEFTPPPEVG